MIKPWETILSKAVGDFRIFTVRSDLKTSPRTGEQHDFYVIDCANWVNVVAVTRQQELVMVEQYRHGSGTIELEIPGGMMDAEDPGPEEAGARELREETGYTGDPPKQIGSVYPNPAIMSNTCYTVLIENCRPTHPTAFDHGEDIHTRLIPLSDIPELIAKGAVQHSLVVAALCHHQLYLREKQ